MIQVLDKDGNTSTDDGGVLIYDKFGHIKRVTGGATPIGPAGGDLSGTYPNPSVSWVNGQPVYDLVYYPLSTNPAGYLTSSALTPYLTSAIAATTYFPIPTGTTSQYIRGDGSLATFTTYALPIATASVLGGVKIGSGVSVALDGTISVSTFTSPLTTKGDLFTFSTVDTRLPLGSNTQILTVDTSTATGLKWAAPPSATPTGYYGAFQDVTNQTAAAINTGYPMRLGITDLSNGVTVVSNSRVTIANTGIYNIQWSAQFTNPTASEHDVTIWLRKNGTDVPGSAGIVLVPAKHGSFDGHTLPSWNFLLDPVAGDYYEFVWSTANTSVYISFNPAGSPPPSTASVVLTVTQQSGIMAGTGITAINSLTGAAQTLTVGTTGTDFAIVDSGVDHKFNLPTASATNRGALSSTDWTTFNNKLNSASPSFTGLMTGVGTTQTGTSIGILDLSQTWNSASSNPTAVKINVTNTLSGATAKLFDVQIAGISYFWVDKNSVYSNIGFTSPVFRAATNGTMTFGNQNISSVTKYVDIATGTLSQTSGTNSAVSISPIYNQVASTAANTDLLVNRTETSVGSGAQNILDLQVAGVSKFRVTTVGSTVIGANLTAGAYTLTGGFGGLIANYDAGANAITILSGTTTMFGAARAYTISSGTGSITGFGFASTINQTGSANGITRGLYINPTLTSAIDFRAIEVVNGSIVLPYRAETANYAIKTSDYLINITSGIVTATLPTAVGCQGKHYIVKNTGVSAVTVATTSSQTIDGVTTVALGVANKYVHVVSTGANWIIIANN